MNRQSLRRLVLISSALALWPVALSSPAIAAAPEAISAHVVSTNAVEIRSCPAPTCAIKAKAPLGADVMVTGEAVDGYVPIRFEETDGFAPNLFVAPDPADPPFLVAGAPGCQRVAFIFNVGVGFEPDSGILDTLQEKQVPATMFVMGWWADENPPILQRMVDEGYLIGTHGYDAIELTSRSDDEVFDDLQRAESAITDATGQPPAPYLTPYAAAIDDRVRAIVAAQGYLPVAWEVSAADYGPDVTEASVYDRVMNGMYDGAIVEFHLDAELSAETTGRALPRIIDELRTQGYQFVTIPEMTQPCE